MTIRWSSGRGASPICCRLAAPQPRQLAESGRAKEGIEQFRVLLDDQTRVLGVDHPDTLRSGKPSDTYCSNAERRSEALQPSTVQTPSSTVTVAA